MHRLNARVLTKIHLRLLAVATCVAIAGCATTTERTARPACDLRSSCFYESSVRSFSLLDDRTMIVEVGGARCPYLVELDSAFCNLSFASMIAFRDSDGRICAVDNAYVMSGPFARDPDDICRVRGVRAISDDELLERRATLGRIPPLPPTGSGELTVEQADDAAETPQAELPQPDGALPSDDVQATR